MGIRARPMTAGKVFDRLQEHAREWRVAVEEAFETDCSAIAFGRRDGLPVVLKVLERPGDEWRSGEVLRAFDGNGVVRVYEHAEGAILVERLEPGTPLVGMVLDDRDEEATDILAGVVRRMSAREPPEGCPTVEDWGAGFDRYLESGDERVPAPLVVEARRVHAELCASQRQPRLLHGDLHHDNVLFDSERGWLAVDPKGVVGEIEYEVGAILRNPVERPDLFASSATIERRIGRLARRLDLDADRALAWGFTQAVLSAIWEVEDGLPMDPTSPFLRLARAAKRSFPPRSSPSSTA